MRKQSRAPAMKKEVGHFGGSNPKPEAGAQSSLREPKISWTIKRRLKIMTDKEWNLLC